MTMNHTLRICGYLWSANHRMYLIDSASVLFLWFSFQKTWLSWKQTVPTNAIGNNVGYINQNCCEFPGPTLAEVWVLLGFVEMFSFMKLLQSKPSLSQGYRLWFRGEMGLNVFRWYFRIAQSKKFSYWLTCTSDWHLTCKNGFLNVVEPFFFFRLHHIEWRESVSQSSF